MTVTRPHPITGEPMPPLGYTRKGRAIWPVAGGAPDGDEGNTGGGTGTPPAGTTTSTGTTGTPPAALTQEAVDALVKDRVARAREAERAKFADYDDAKAKAARLDALEADNATTLEKERTKAKAEGGAEVLARANGLLVAAEVRAQAAGKQFRDPLDALRLVQATGALANVKVAEDGTVDGAAITAALDALATDKPYLLVDKTPPPPATPGAAGVGSGSNGATRKDTTKGMGTLRDAYGANAAAKT